MGKIVFWYSVLFFTALACENIGMVLFLLFIVLPIIFFGASAIANWVDWNMTAEEQMKLFFENDENRNKTQGEEMTLEEFKKKHNLKTKKDLRNYLQKKHEQGLSDEIMYCPLCHTISNEHEPCPVCFPELFKEYNAKLHEQGEK